MFHGSSRAHIVLLALLALLVSSCASYGSQLARLNNEGQHREAALGAETWLREHASEENTAPWDAVLREFARASLGIARETDTVRAYTEFLERFRHWRSLADIMQQGRELQAAAELRDQVAPARSIDELRAFRGRTDGTQAAVRAWTLEAQLAFERAEADGSTEAFRAFRQRYNAAPGVEALLTRALRREAERALDAVIAEATIEAFQDFRERYADAPALEYLRARARSLEARLAFDAAVVEDTPAAYRVFIVGYVEWAEASALITEARHREGAAALRDAVAEGTVEALERFRGAYPQAPWPARADEAILSLVLGPLRRELSGQGRVVHADVDRLLAALETHQTLLRGARPPENAVFVRAQTNANAALWRFVVALYPDASWITQAHERLRDALLAEATNAPSSEAWLRFVQHFPEDGGAVEGVRFLQTEREFARSERRGYAVSVGRRRVDSSGVELTITVRDCSQETVIGLPASAFRVYEGGVRQTVTSFLGMEDARPLTVEMALDLSGSMAVEQNAVRLSMVRFLDMLRYRGRDTRVGLVGFSDTVMADHRPTEDPGEFALWMSRLPQGVGGAIGEDGVGALTRSLDALSRERAERVVVLLSDEPLQSNAGGRNALRTERDCAQAMGVANCIVAAQGQPRRELACFQRLRGWSVPVSRCARRYPAPYCVASFFPALRGSIARCSDASGLVAPLAERLGAGGVRPFFLVSDGHDGRDAFGAYRTLATGLGGAVLQVPNDATDPAPYSAALYRVADELSSQYVLRYRGAGGAGPQSPRVLIRPQHGWVRSPFVGLEATAVRSLGGSADCPSLLAVRPDGGVLRSARCGAGWSDANVQAEGVAVVSAADGRGAVALHDGGMGVFSADGLVRIAPDGGVLRYGGLAFDAAGRLWALGHGANEDWVRAFDRAGRTVVDWPLSTRGELFAMVPTARDATVCVLSADGMRRCRLVGSESWETRASTGLPLASVTATLSADVGYAVLLAATRDGGVYRSVDRGRSFAQVLSVPPSWSANFALSPAGDLLCAGIGVQVWCSEDDGQSWFGVGAESASQGATGVFFVGERLYAAQGGRLEEAHRVLTRELPGAASLFDTALDEPRAGASALLQGTARTMASDPRLLLRVEGHADSRGTHADNDALAARRAERVAQLLEGFGVSRGRMQVESFGERRPIRTGTSAADLARNRRVELTVLAPIPTGGWYANHCRSN